MTVPLVVIALRVNGFLPNYGIHHITKLYLDVYFVRTMCAVKTIEIPSRHRDFCFKASVNAIALILK